MTIIDNSALITETRNNWMRLQTLVALRWIAVLGQTVAILIASKWLSLDLPIDLCFTAIGASVAFNLVAMAIWPRGKRLSDPLAGTMLLFDLFQLSVLLYLSGGLSNPFSILMLVPVTISATALSLRATAVLGVIFIMMITTLIWFYLPLRTLNGNIIQQPSLLIFGNWTALVTGFSFLALYARRVTVENFSMSEALAATQLALGREQRLTSLGGVIAAAAHELGTPLATIKLTASELADELIDQPELAKDAQLIRSQADRCRDILRDMGRSGKEDMHVKTAPISSLIEEAAMPHLDRGKRVIIRIDGDPLSQNSPDQPLVWRRSETIHGLRNLIQNAVDFAVDAVWVDVDWNDAKISVRIGDDGTGFPAEVMGKIGDPFVGRRHRRKRAGYEGMGLGLFIAKTLLERTGAELTFSNGQTGEHDLPIELSSPTGAIVTVIWDRKTLQTPDSKARPALGANTRIES